MMCVKGFKKMAAALALVVLLVSTAYAAPAGSALLGGVADAAGNDNPLEQVLEDGIRITVEGVRRNDARPPQGWNSPSFHSISLLFRVTAPEDTTVRIEAHNIYDNLGNEFLPGFRGGQTGSNNAMNAESLVIGGQNVSERLIVAYVPTLVEILFECPADYSLASVFPRVSFAVNRQTVTFRNVPGRP